MLGVAAALTAGFWSSRMDWDPEMMLVIEARKTASGLAWYYSPVRFSETLLRLEHKGVQVWSSLQKTFGGVNLPYFVRPRISARNANLTDSM